MATFEHDKHLKWHRNKLIKNAIKHHGLKAISQLDTKTPGTYWVERKTNAGKVQ